MTEEELIEACDKGALIRHEKGDSYILLFRTEIKISGVWVSGMSYQSLTTNKVYTRETINFKKFVVGKQIPKGTDNE